MVIMRMKRDLRKAYVSSTQETLSLGDSVEHSVVLDVYLIEYQKNNPFVIYHLTLETILLNGI